jgi:osmotically-inducible protein OsmY
MRVPQRIAFPIPEISAPMLSANLQTQYAALQSRLPGVSVSAGDAGHIVLQGVVDSEQARKLAEAIARLEPGVRTITNELIVGEGSESTLAPHLGR